jgi:hypothetical protein
MSTAGCRGVLSSSVLKLEKKLDKPTDIPRLLPSTNRTSSPLKKNANIIMASPRRFLGMPLFIEV